MANYFNAFLGGVTNQGNQFKDFQHATRLYVDDLYALSPKQGFLYYVVFEIDESVLPTNGQWTNNRKQEVGLLVKGCDLPKFSVSTEVLNQYNRKTYVQSKINYTPVNFTFHDDHSNVTNALWQNYYTYYFADAASNTQQFSQPKFTTPPGFKDTKYETNTAVFQHTDYGLNNDQDKPFFRAITIYQLNRKKFASYTLINPMVTEWSHDRVEQSNNNKLLENKMTVGYETVVYGIGTVKKDTPTGFATFHYDNTPSPLSILGGGSKNVFGPGGVIDGVNEIFGDLSSDGQMSGADIFKTAVKGANVLKNIKNLNGAAVAAEGLGMLTGAIKGFGNNQNLPTSTSAGAGTVAGFALNLFRIKTKKDNDAKPAEVTEPKSSQVVQSDVSKSNITSNGENDIPSSLPDPLPTDAETLNLLLQQQENLISLNAGQISDAENMKADFDARMAAATDDDEIQAIENEKISKGYTDPAKLQAMQSKLEADAETVRSALNTANQSLSAPSTLTVDDVDLGTSDESNLDSYVNEDYNTAQDSSGQWLDG